MLCTQAKWRGRAKPQVTEATWDARWARREVRRDRVAGVTRHDSPDAARRRFFAAALRVCGDKGFAATRMADIAEAAGRSKGALYHHFATKQELFIELLHMLVDELSTEVDEGMLGERPAHELVERTMISVVEGFGGSDLFRVLVELMPAAARDPELRVPLMRYYAQALQTCTTLIRWGQRRGELRPDIDARRVARALVMGGHGIYLVGTALGEVDQSVDDVRQLYARILDGVRSPGTTT